VPDMYTVMVLADETQDFRILCVEVLPVWIGLHSVAPWTWVRRPVFPDRKTAWIIAKELADALSAEPFL